MKKIQKQDNNMSTIKVKPTALYITYGHYAKYWDNDGKTPPNSLAYYKFKDGSKIIVATNNLKPKETKKQKELRKADFVQCISKVLFDKYGVPAKYSWIRKHVI